LHKIYQKEFLNILNDLSFTWHYTIDADTSDTPEFQKFDDSITKYDQFVRLMDAENFSYWHDVFTSAIQGHFKVEVKKILRMRLVFGYPRPLLKQFHYGTPHVDIEDIPHKTLIYYGNTNNASTVFFKEFYQDKLDYTKKSIAQMVKPVQGRAVMFDGFRYHSAQPNSDTNRLILNVNFTV
ncbi:MAG: hypothetical protein EB127_17040, partial [Alphaproteobacteria bacterium]|nr:hypothetical protein [Alphaproteobacteria bacterium]